MGKRSQKGRTQAGPTPVDLGDLPFEKALAELEEIVETLEEGTLSLEDSLARFERGIHLSRHLESQLKRAEQRVRQLVGEAGDEGALVDFDETAGSDDDSGGARDDADADDEEGDDDDSPQLPF